MSVEKALDKLAERLEKDSDCIREITDADRLVFFSDLHRGVGGPADDFAHNSLIFKHTLEYYLDNGFTYVEVGDGDELWENKHYNEIVEMYHTIFDLMGNFSKDKLILIYGNHNIACKGQDFVRQHLGKYIQEPVFHEAIKFKYSFKHNGGRESKDIFVFHGHQGFFLNDKGWRIGKFIVRHFWKHGQEILGLKDPTSPAKNFKIREEVEGEIYSWAQKRRVLVITGHTHRSVFMSQTREGNVPGAQGEKPYYFNDGSCVHPRCITAIEINQGFIRLVKWHRDLVEQQNPESPQKGTRARQEEPYSAVVYKRALLEDNTDGKPLEQPLSKVLLSL